MKEAKKSNNFTWILAFHVQNVPNILRGEYIRYLGCFYITNHN